MCGTVGYVSHRGAYAIAVIEKGNHDEIIAVYKRRNVNQPRNLAKSVTVE